MLLNAYPIFLGCTGGTIKMIVQVGGLVSGGFQSGGVSPRTVQLWGEAIDGKTHFPLMTKGERFIRCRIEIIGEREQRKVDKRIIPRRVQSGGEAPKGDTLFH
jgi:hypothetical protein